MAKKIFILYANLQKIVILKTNFRRCKRRQCCPLPQFIVKAKSFLFLLSSWVGLNWGRRKVSWMLSAEHKINPKIVPPAQTVFALWFFLRVRDQGIISNNNIKQLFMDKAMKGRSNERCFAQEWMFHQALAASTAQELVHWPPGGGGHGRWAGGRGWEEDGGLEGNVAVEGGHDGWVEGLTVPL